MIETLSTIGTKCYMGAAACAMAGAAVLAPGVAAASPVAPMPIAGLGSSTSALCEDVESDQCLSPVATAGAGGSANATAEGPFRNNLIWIGEIPDPAPENIAVFEYNIIPLFSPEIQAAAYAWWDEVIPNGINACLLGATAKIDSYSTLTVGFTKGCSG